MYSYFELHKLNAPTTLEQNRSDGDRSRGELFAARLLDNPPALMAVPKCECELRTAIKSGPTLRLVPAKRVYPAGQEKCEINFLSKFPHN